MASKVSGVIEKIQTGGSSGTSHAIASTAYGYCETAASEPIKNVDMTGFKLYEGVTIHVKFANANSASNPPKLKFNSEEDTKAKPIVQYGTTAVGTTSETNGWYAGAVLTLTYDGTSWVRDQDTWNALSTSQAGYVTQAPNNTAQFLRGDASWSVLPTASTNTAGIIQIGTEATNAAAGNHNHDDAYVNVSGDTMNGNLTLSSSSGDSPAIIFDRGSSLTDWKLVVTSGKLSFQSRIGTNAFTERGSFGDNTGAFTAASYNGLTLTKATTGFTIAGGTTSKTLTVSENSTLKGGSQTYLTYYSAANTLAGHGLAHFSDTYSSSTKNGKNELVLGNTTAKDTNNSAYGQLALYSPGTKGTYLMTEENSTAWYTATLQAKSGTIALIDDVNAVKIEILDLTGVS